jgi:hypothetical protein
MVFVDRNNGCRFPLDHIEKQKLQDDKLWMLTVEISRLVSTIGFLIINSF